VKFFYAAEKLRSEFSRMSQSQPGSANKAYARVAQVVMDPRDLEASLLLKAAAKLKAVLEAWDQKRPSALADALLYNRRLWIVFIDAVMRDDKAADRDTPERAEFGRVRNGWGSFRS
jgi:hypothetical protein